MRGRAYVLYADRLFRGVRRNSYAHAVIGVCTAVVLMYAIGPPRGRGYQLPPDVDAQRSWPGRASEVEGKPRCQQRANSRHLERFSAPSSSKTRDGFGLRLNRTSVLSGALLLKLVCVFAHGPALLLRSGHRSEEQLTWSWQESPRPPCRQ